MANRNRRVPKVILQPVAQYHRFGTAASGLVAGQVLGFTESLGGRPAREITITSPDGDSSFRFNVVQRVYDNHGNLNPWMMDGGRSPTILGEVEIDTPEITIAAGDTQVWNDFPIENMKPVVVSGLSVLVT